MRIKITKKEYWKIFPLFYRLILKFRHWKHKKKKRKSPEFTKQWNNFINEIDKFMAFGDKNGKSR